MVQIIQGANNLKPVSSELASNFFSNETDQEGFFYTGYPIIQTSEGGYQIDALFMSPKYGMIIFNLAEEQSDLEDYKFKQDKSYSLMEAKLKSNPNLSRKRELIIPLKIVTFSSSKSRTGYKNEIDKDYPLFFKDTLNGFFEWIDENVQFDEKDFQAVLSAIQSISTLRKNPYERNISKDIDKCTRGAKLSKLEEQISNLDPDQSEAVIKTFDGIQRIRGLAGSGKTVVLALKAAYLHATYPDWKIAVTFNTRSLKGQFKSLIERFYYDQTGMDPNWNNLQILHAWGAPGSDEKNGVYYEFIRRQDSGNYLDFNSAKRRFGYDNAFSGACKKALDSMNVSPQIYDIILIDEAQDFPKYFFRICAHMVSDKYRIVYAYDELQNLSNTSIESPEKLFNTMPNGQAVLFNPYNNPEQDIVLEVCYRNSKPILTSAHGLGFGIYRKENEKTGSGLVQMFDDESLWTDVGYEDLNNNLDYGNHVRLQRTSKASPQFLEEHSDIDDLIIFQNFQTKEDQYEWVVEQIENDINEEKLLPSDIIVINPNPLTTKDEVAEIRKQLFQRGINSHLAGVTSTPDEFSLSNSVTFTGIYRAKGNEAGMVYVINANDCYGTYGSVQTQRNRLFTAMTRSKAWLRVVGVGTNMDYLIDEYSKIYDNRFILEFNYPTREQLEKIQRINRDRSEAELNQINQTNKVLDETLDKLMNGDSGLSIDDIDPEVLFKLNSILQSENEENDYNG